MLSVSVFGDLMSPTQVIADNVVTAIGKAAEATPRAGSVTQSSNVDANDITTDLVEVTAQYGGGRPPVSVGNGTAWSIAMDEGTPRSLNATHPWNGVELSKDVSGGTVYVDAYTDIKTPSRPPVNGTSGDTTFYNGEDLTALGQNTMGSLNGVSGLFTCAQPGGCAEDGSRIQFVPNAGTPDTDYLAGGVWLLVPDDRTSADDYAFGAFVDGNDTFSQSNITALQGTATYEGGATGVYSEKTAESTAIGYFNGDVELTANFGGTSELGTISGSITNFEVDGESEVGTLNLGTANIGSQDSGFFKGSVTGSDAERMYVGNWGGQFFGNGESDGKPGSVGGTFGGHSTDDAVNFVGAFGAHKQ